jgi:hypothetical protein
VPCCARNAGNAHFTWRACDSCGVRNRQQAMRGATTLAGPATALHLRVWPGAARLADTFSWEVIGECAEREVTAVSRTSGQAAQSFPAHPSRGKVLQANDSLV